MNTETLLLTWDSLVFLAERGQHETYSEFGIRIGRIPVGVGRVLEPIQQFLLNHNPVLPGLTALVVNKDSGEPGGGFVAGQGRSMDEILAEVYRFDWSHVREDFASWANARADQPAALSATKSPPWTPEENRSATDAYLEMLANELAGLPFVKKTVNSDLRAGPLKGRNASAVEYRMQNISWVLSDIGLPWIRGYKPAQHVGPGPAAQIRAALDESDLAFLDHYRYTADSVELERRASLIPSPTPKPPRSENRPVRVAREVTVFTRRPQVVSWVREASNGTCESCGAPAPFQSGGQPFLEVHHVIPLSEGGLDTVENAVAVCPNCHRNFHLGDAAGSARASLYARVTRLRSQERIDE